MFILNSFRKLKLEYFTYIYHISDGKKYLVLLWKVQGVKSVILSGDHYPPKGLLFVSDPKDLYILKAEKKGQIIEKSLTIVKSIIEPFFPEIRPEFNSYDIHLISEPAIVASGIFFPVYTLKGFNTEIRKINFDFSGTGYDFQKVVYNLKNLYSITTPLKYYSFAFNNFSFKFKTDEKWNKLKNSLMK